jgi:hypothetical protein
MSESLEAIKKLIDGCSQEDLRALRLYLCSLLPHALEREWGVDADTILSAISRSSDLTKRGVRGIIAEAVFVNEVAPIVAPGGWQLIASGGDRPYDALLKNGDREARIQVKLQRLELGVPKLYYPKHYESGSLFVVEVQKTRTGEKTSKRIPAGAGEPASTIESITVKTRPYSFGDFDILAVNMHPSSGDWRNFRYTVASWLLPRRADKSLIEIFQPVAATPNKVWTDDLGLCLKWFESGEQRSLLAEPLRLRPLKGHRS